MTFAAGAMRRKHRGRRRHCVCDKSEWIHKHIITKYEYLDVGVLGGVRVRVRVRVVRVRVRAFACVFSYEQ